MRTRKRFRFILVALFVVCAMLFLESRIEAFVPQIKNFAEVKVSSTFGGNLDFSIGSIDGGILHPIVFNDVRIKNAKGSPFFTSFAITSLKTNYRIWDVIFKRAGSSAAFVNFTTTNKGVEGFAYLRANTPAGLDIRGSLNIFNREGFDFDGRIKDNSFRVEIRPRDSGVVMAEGTILDDGVLDANLKINHLKVRGFDIVCEVNLKDRVIRPADDPTSYYLEGNLETKNLILNYKPFLDLKASYRIRRGIAEITDLSIGDNILKIRGKAVLSQPYNIDITLTASNLNLGWMLASFGVRDSDSILSGTANCKVELKGPVKDLKSNIHIEMKKGTIATLDFETLSANLKGDGPFVRIEDSRIARESGYFVLGGEMDLRKIGKASMFDDLRLVTDDRAITWDGWRTTKSLDIQEVSMKKRINEYINLDFKKFVSDEKVDESFWDSDEVHLEYKLDANDSFRMMVGQDKDFFGLEHKDKF